MPSMTVDAFEASSLRIVHSSFAGQLENFLAPNWVRMAVMMVEGSAPAYKVGKSTSATEAGSL